MGGDCLLETENGLVGKASGSVQKGDVICVLFGCPMSTVMRQVGENWKIVQSCYIYGMDGQASLMSRRISTLFENTHERQTTGHDSKWIRRGRVTAPKRIWCDKFGNLRTIFIISFTCFKTRTSKLPGDMKSQVVRGCGRRFL